MAKSQAAGHITIIRFTSGWKVTFSTPDLLTGSGWGEVSKLKNYDSIKEAIKIFD
jgi:hypothetical protein